MATTRGEIKADKVVLATGAAQGVGRQIAGIEIPQRSTPGIIAITEPLPPVLNRILVAPGIHLHQRQDGRLVIGEQSGVPSNKAHTKRLQARSNRFPDNKFSQQHAGRMIEIAAVPASDQASECRAGLHRVSAFAPRWPSSVGLFACAL